MTVGLHISLCHLTVLRDESEGKDLKVLPTIKNRIKETVPRGKGKHKYFIFYCPTKMYKFIKLVHGK